MYWHDVLDHSRAVIIFESIENSRTAMPMTDASGMQQFRRSQEEQLNFIWSTMFPRSVEYDNEMREKREVFKGRKHIYKEMQDNINKSRGTYSEPQNE